VNYFYSDMKNGLILDESATVEILYDDDVIIQSIKNIVATVSNERVRNPIGCSVIRLLFEKMTADTAELMADSLTEIISLYEPRVEIKTLRVRADYDNNVYEIHMVLKIIPYGKIIKYTTRLRSLSDL
jgi:phage baseplate assembly protein W